MPQPRAPKTDWMLEAWNLATALADVPIRPLKIGSVALPLDDALAQQLREIQEHLSTFLSYRVRKELRASAPRTAFGSGDSRPAVATRNALTKAGMVFSDRDHAAIGVHSAIAFILSRNYADGQMKSQLPVILASVSGTSVALQNAIRASKPRGGRNDPNAELRAAKRRYTKQGLSCKEILAQLYGDGLVREWHPAKGITWVGMDGEQRRVALGTFKNWR
jgi:hypothetical protein